MEIPMTRSPSPSTRFARTRLAVLAALSASFIATACNHAPPPPPLPPPPLTDSAEGALTWVQAHASPIVLRDSTPPADERRGLAALASGARILGLSELTEGTAEFPEVVRRTLITLVDSGFKGVAIQAPMAEALEIDRYVRGGGTGGTDLRHLLHALGSWRFETKEMAAFVGALRDWNHAHPDKPIGFYGFEIPSAALAVRTVMGLPDSVMSPDLRTWLARQYGCVAENESAHFGLEGRTADSSFWNSCAPTTRTALDSIVAARGRARGAYAMTQLAFAEQMARLINHHVTVGLRHLPRQEGNAEHVMFLADQFGPEGRIVLWGGDVEMGRVTLDRTTVQTGVPLGKRLTTAYRPVAFAIGAGRIRARVPSVTNRPGLSGPGGRGSGEPGFADTRVARPAPESYEDVLNRVTGALGEAFWLDARALPKDKGGAWLRGPRPIRLITELYSPVLPTAFETSIEIPSNFDGIVFVKTPSPVHQ
jgi:erythromycin esterase-like protein